MMDASAKDPARAETPPQEAGFWLFAYGSLMWDPGFAPAETLPARIRGWHRRFDLRSTTKWGSEDAPGLCAVLHPGGSALGRALRVGPEAAAETLAYLDAREAAYRRRRVRLDIGRPAARRLVALTYVVDPLHPRLMRGLPPDEAARMARQGVGTSGSSLDYVRNTVAALAADGARTSDAHRFFAMIAN